MASPNKRKSKKHSKQSPKSLTVSPEVVPSPQVQTSGNPLQIYFNHISKIPILTREEEYKLMVRYYKTKDPKIATKLIQSNLRFVVKIASEYGRFSSKIMDLIQEGNMGLVRAVQEFNPYKGARLITYAVWWIRGYIQEYLIKHYSIVRLGTNKKQRKLFYQLQKEKRNLEQYSASKLLPTLAASTQFTEKEVEEMRELILKRDVSLNQPLKKDSSTTFLDLQVDSDLSVEDQLSLQEQNFLLRKHLAIMEKDLSQKEKAILKNRLLKDPPATLQEVANEFGVTREAIRQSEERLLKKMREKMIPILKKPY